MDYAKLVGSAIELAAFVATLAACTTWVAYTVARYAVKDGFERVLRHNTRANVQEPVQGGLERLAEESALWFTPFTSDRELTDEDARWFRARTTSELTFWLYERGIFVRAPLYDEHAAIRRMTPEQLLRELYKAGIFRL